jgi:hypothetical protein
MPFIRESIVTTLNPDGSAHVAPLGVIEQGTALVIAPFEPSTTLRNLRRHPFACISYTVDVRVFSGCVTRLRSEWPVVRADRIEGWRLAGCLAHAELQVESVAEDVQRPRFLCAQVCERVHAPFLGFNRAQAAVVEGAILVSRLGMLPDDKIDGEMAYLQIAIDKTAGEREREAWGWLLQAVDDWKSRRNV